MCLHISSRAPCINISNDRRLGKCLLDFVRETLILYLSLSETVMSNAAATLRFFKLNPNFQTSHAAYRYHMICNFERYSWVFLGCDRFDKVFAYYLHIQSLLSYLIKNLDARENNTQIQ